MNLVERSIRFGGEKLTLTNQRALYWSDQETLILSDLHLGKAAHFRKSGIAIPTQTMEADLLRLEKLMKHYRPGRVAIVGDLIHAGTNSETAHFASLTQVFASTKFILIRGNHDRVSANQLRTLGIGGIYDQYRLGTIWLVHEQPTGNSSFTHPAISGHIHPGVVLQLPSRQRLKFPCFVVSKRQGVLILPAFSRFTGLDTRTRLPLDSVRYGFHEDGFFVVDESS